MTKEERIKEFLEEYGKLTKKYKVDLASYPMLVPSEGGKFDIIMQSTPVDLEELNKNKEFISK